MFSGFIFNWSAFVVEIKHNKVHTVQKNPAEITRLLTPPTYKCVCSQSAVLFTFHICSGYQLLSKAGLLGWLVWSGSKGEINILMGAEIY